MIDIHCHLQDDRFTESTDVLLRRARENGVSHVVCCGTAPRDWERVERLAGDHPEVIPFFGVHPWFINKLMEDWAQLLEDMLSRVPSGVGEIGLDFSDDMPDRHTQLHVCEKQLQLAAKRNLPVSIHCRKAWGELIALLDGVKLTAGGLIHAWSGGAQMLRAFEKRGMFISFGGSVTRTRNKKAHQAIAAVAPEMLLIETDSPDMVPEGINDDLNQPSYLLEVAEAAAHLRNTSTYHVDELTSRNSRKFLNGLMRQ